MSGDFYVGYRSRAPEALARFLRPRILALSIGAGALIGLLLVAQRPPDAATFDFGAPTTLEGVIRETPYPTLALAADEGTPIVAVLLGRFGKLGVADRVGGLGGKHVRLKGELAYRDALTHVEIDPESIEIVAPGTSPEAATQPLGELQLRGEIVDTKCWAGVMNPGRGKVHRSCAARCLAGGIAPALPTKGADPEVFLLVDHERRPISAALSAIAGETVTLRGEAYASEGLRYLALRSEALQRLSGDQG